MGRLFPSHTHLSAGHSRHPPAGHLPVLRCNLATRWQTPNVSRAPTGRVSAAVQPCHPPADNRRYAGSHRPNIRRGATLPPAAFRRGATLPPCPADTRRPAGAHRPGIRRGATTRRLSLRPSTGRPPAKCPPRRNSAILPADTRRSAGHSRRQQAMHLPVPRCNFAARLQTHFLRVPTAGYLPRCNLATRRPITAVMRAPTGRMSAAAQLCHPAG